MAVKRKPNGPQVAPGGEERRDGGRVMQPRQVAIYPCHAQGLGRPIRASLTDASPTSIGLVCLGRLPLGAHFVLRLHRGSGPPVLQVYHVVRSRDAGGGACLIGAQYDQDFAVACPLPSTGESVPAPVDAPAAC
ncbi:MAG: hypothetical protein M3478_09455 [Planctomycetota bacterium]|nr:hypothetical protein [Planctomycetota bacterium]